MAVMESSLNEKAQKHKKLFETYKINPIHLSINNNDFYMVKYTRKVMGQPAFAIIASNTDAPSVDYQTAFEQLMIMFTNIESIGKNGTERKNINMRAFHEVQNFFEDTIKAAKLSEQEKEHYSRAFYAINGNLEYQGKHVEVMEEYESFFKKKKNTGLKYTLEEAEYILNVVLELDYIQFTQLKISRDMADDFSFIKDSIKSNSSIQEFANHEVKRYVEEFAKNKKSLEAEIATITHVDGMEHMTKEEHIEAARKHLMNMQYEGFVGHRKGLRHPIY